MVQGSGRETGSCLDSETMKSQLLEKLILLALVIGILLFVYSDLSSKIKEFAERTSRSIEDVNVEQVAVRRR